MKLDKKGLTNEEIQNLIEEHVKWKSYYTESVLPLLFSLTCKRIWVEALRESKILE